MKEGLFSEYGLICLTDLDKRRLNNLARTALLTKNADVIISLGAQQVISREFKPAKTHMTTCRYGYPGEKAFRAQLGDLL